MKRARGRPLPLPYYTRSVSQLASSLLGGIRFYGRWVVSGGTLDWVLPVRVGRPRPTQAELIFSAPAPARDCSVSRRPFPSVPCFVTLVLDFNFTSRPLNRVVVFPCRPISSCSCDVFCGEIKVEQQRTADKGDSLPAKLLPTGNKGSSSGKKQKKDRTYGNFCGGTQKCPERNYGDVLCPAFFLVAFLYERDHSVCFYGE